MFAVIHVLILVGVVAKPGGGNIVHALIECPYVSSVSVNSDFSRRFGGKFQTTTGLTSDLLAYAVDALEHGSALLGGVVGALTHCVAAGHFLSLSCVVYSGLYGGGGLLIDALVRVLLVDLGRSGDPGAENRPPGSVGLREDRDRGSPGLGSLPTWKVSKVCLFPCEMTSAGGARCLVRG